MRTDWKLENYRRKDPFRVPEGYFDSLTDRVMNRLPEQQIQVKKPRAIGLRPYLYVAAAFAGFILCCGSLFHVSNTTQQREMALQDSIYMEEMMDYTMMDNLTIHQYLTEAW